MPKGVGTGTCPGDVKLPTRTVYHTGWVRQLAFAGRTMTRLSHQRHNWAIEEMLFEELEEEFGIRVEV